MKTKRIFFALLLCIVMIVSSMSVSFASNSSDTGLVPTNGSILETQDQTVALNNEIGYSSEELKSMERFDKAFLKNQSKASEAYQKLIKSFGTVGIPDASDFPEYYGGAYINDEGKLVINVTSNTTSISQDFNKRTGTDEFILKPSKYSFKMLTKIMDTLNTYKLKKADSPISANFNSYALLDAQNSIVVYLDEYNQEQIEAFKKQVLDSSAIEFKKATGKVKDEINVNPGSSITSGGSGGSVGYRARRGGVDGIITAGHVAAFNADVEKDGTIFASCTAREFSGSVDASFCRITNSNYTPTNTLEGTSNTLSTTISEPGVGTVINKIGASTGHTSGKIISTNASATYLGVTFTNLTSADYVSAAGDSGGIVYSYIISTNTRLTLGIHVASDGTTRYYVKANQINSALGTSRY